MQETRFELWIPVHHTTQLQHWTAATDALDHVILTAAALESVLEGMLSGSDAAVTVIERRQMTQIFDLQSAAFDTQCRADKSDLQLQCTLLYHQSTADLAKVEVLSPLKPWLCACMHASADH